MTVYFEGFKNVVVDDDDNDDDDEDDDDDVKEEEDDDDDDDVKEEDDNGEEDDVNEEEEDDGTPDSDVAGICTGTDLSMSSSKDSKHFVIHPTTPLMRILSWPLLGCSIENEGLLIAAIILLYINLLLLFYAWLG